MRLIAFAVVAAASMAGIAAHETNAPQQTNAQAYAPYVTKMPAGYRDYRFINVAHEAGGLNSLGAMLGNDIAIKAAREGKLPYPDGAIIARLAWSYDPLEESAKAFGRLQSFVAGPPKNGVQFMVKDSSKYAATGGWGFAQFDSGKPADEAMQKTCFPCHEIVKARDFVFNRYAP